MAVPLGHTPSVSECHPALQGLSAAGPIRPLSYNSVLEAGALDLPVSS